MPTTTPFLKKFAKEAPEPTRQDIANREPTATTTPPPSPTIRTRVNGETTDDS